MKIPHLFGRIALAASMLLGSLAAQATEFRSSDIHPEDYPTVLAVRHMGETLSKATGGKHSIKVYAKGSLGIEKDTIEQTKLGAIAMTRVNVAPMNNICPATMVPTMPFLFRDKEHMRKVLDGAIGDEILKDCESQGFVGLAFYDSGARSIYTVKKPVKTLADVKGLKVRVQQSDLWVSLLEAMGANATPMPFGEVYTALKTGLVDAAENNYPSYESSRHFEVAKYFNKTEHSMAPEILVMSKVIYDKLPKAEQDMIRAGVTDMLACVDTMEEMFGLLYIGDYRMAGPNNDSHGAMVIFPKESPFPNMPKPTADRRMMAMPAYLGGNFCTAGVKWYGSNIANRDKGLPRSILMFTLNDPDTGAPLAHMSANLLSAYRTGAIPGVGARHLAEGVYLEQAARQAEIIDRAMSEAVPDAWRRLKNGEAPATLYREAEGQRLLAGLTREVHELGLTSLKIYGPGGVILYATDNRRIGTADRSPAYVAAAESGTRSVVHRVDPDGDPPTPAHRRDPRRFPQETHHRGTCGQQRTKNVCRV